MTTPTPDLADWLRDLEQRDPERAREIRAGLRLAEWFDERDERKEKSDDKQDD